MKRLMILLTILTLMCIFNLNSFAQNKAKAKTKAKITKPASNPNYIGETEKNLSKSKNTQNKTEAAVFEPNDANTWLKDNPKENARTPNSNEKDGKIMDIVDMAKQPEGENSTQPDSSKVEGTPKQKGVAQVGLNKNAVVFNDVIVSSKTSKPKRKPTKSTTSKRKPN